MLAGTRCFAELGPHHDGALPQGLYARLKRRILTCALAPGSELVERELACELAVSRTPLRETLARLAYEGLVVRRPYTGYVVAPLTEAGWRDLCEFRALLEPEAAALAARRATAADVEELLRLVRDGRKPRSFHEAARRHSLFHHTLARIVRNDSLQAQLGAAHDLQLRAVYDAWRRGTLTQAPVDREHEAIGEAVARGDADAARALMTRHVGAHARRIRAALLAPGRSR